MQLQDTFRTFGVALVAFYAASASAQWKYDEKQAALLPPYCKYTQLYRDVAPGGKNPAEIERWATIMGGDGNFMHLHHYCWGLEYTNRGLYGGRSKQVRDELFRLSIPEFDYVISQARPDFVLMPEILTKKGENLLRIERAAEAIPALHRAIELKHQYWPPYVALSDYFKELGQIAVAREWLEKGLAAAPNTQPLLRRLAELDQAKGRRQSR
jgi:tetratricopeptide (TPR) repeat protein